MKPYKAKSLSGAQSYVRSLLKQRATTNVLLDRVWKERDLLAKLSAEGPTFFNPLDVLDAKRVRDARLKEMGMNPDGSFIKHGKQ